MQHFPKLNRITHHLHKAHACCHLNVLISVNRAFHACANVGMAAFMGAAPKTRLYVSFLAAPCKPEQQPDTGGQAVVEALQQLVGVPMWISAQYETAVLDSTVQVKLIRKDLFTAARCALAAAIKLGLQSPPIQPSPPAGDLPPVLPAPTREIEAGTMRQRMATDDFWAPVKDKLSAAGPTQLAGATPPGLPSAAAMFAPPMTLSRPAGQGAAATAAGSNSGASAAAPAAMCHDELGRQGDGAVSINRTIL